MTTPQIERGEPRPVIDAIGRIIAIPDKIVLWNRRVENHAISRETEAVVVDYLAANELTAVKVRLNQYAPGDEWVRLTKNKSVSWGWRYSLGTVSWLGDTLFPGRIWGGDHYNPFTNTVHLYGDVPAIALHEAGHAKDFSRRRFPGTYAAVYALVPVAPLYHEAVATRDALGYLQSHGTAAERREAYSILYPAYGTYVGASIGDFMPGFGWAAQAVAIVGGHAVGRFRASRIPDDGDKRLTEASSSERNEAPITPIGLAPPDYFETGAAGSH